MLMERTGRRLGQLKRESIIKEENERTASVLEVLETIIKERRLSLSAVRLQSGRQQHCYIASQTCTHSWFNHRPLERVNVQSRITQAPKFGMPKRRVKGGITVVLRLMLYSRSSAVIHAGGVVALFLVYGLEITSMVSYIDALRLHYIYNCSPIPVFCFLCSKILSITKIK